MTLTSSPTLNSAGHTRFPTFSMMRTSKSPRGSSARPERTMLASRWHSPPKPGSVFTCTSGTWKRDKRSASRVVCTSPSRTPRRSLSCRRPSVCSTPQRELGGSIPRTALAALPRYGNLLYIKLRALDRRSLCHQLEPKGEGGGDDLAQVADLQMHLRDPPPVGVAAGYLDHRVCYGELVHAR